MADLPRKDTAEEQLLRLIEGAQPPKPDAPPASGGSSSGPSWRNRLLQEWSAASSHARMRWHALFRARPRGGDTVLRQLRLAGRFVWVALAGLGIYIAVTVALVPARRPQVAFDTGRRPGREAVKPPSPDTLMKPMADYLSSVLQRNPFTGNSGGTAAAPVQRARERLKELVGSLVVVGIDRGATPEALIEDKAQGRTYFVKVGDVVNGAFVKEISSRGVIVEYEGEEELLQ